MSFSIPNLENNPSFDAQSIADSTDWNAVANSSEVFLETGGLVTAGSSLSVNISAGTGVSAGTSVAWSAVTNLAVNTASTYDRRDIVVVNTSGVVSVVAGTPCNTPLWTRYSVPAYPPVKPSIPTGDILLSEVYVSSSTVTITANNIIDKRVTGNLITAIESTDSSINVTQTANLVNLTANGTNVNVMIPYSNAGAAPANTVGENGDTAFETNTGKIFGPKASGVWPSSPIFTV